MGGRGRSEKALPPEQRNVWKRPKSDGSTTGTPDDSKRDLDEVRSRFLGRNPLSSIREAFSEIRRGEARRLVMMPKLDESGTKSDGSGLVGKGGNSPMDEGGPNMV